MIKVCLEYFTDNDQLDYQFAIRGRHPTREYDHRTPFPAPRPHCRHRQVRRVGGIGGFG